MTNTEFEKDVAENWICLHPLYTPLRGINGWNDAMEYYSAIKKNSFESVLMRWMKLELIIYRVK